MRRLAVVASFALLATGTTILLRADSRNNPPDPFFDTNDKGETVHVLPAPETLRQARGGGLPTFAPPRNTTTVYQASYGSGNLIDHGGLEIANAGFFAIYWNSSVADSTQTAAGATIENEINAFINAFPDSSNWDNSATDDYAVVQQYGSHASIAPTLTNANTTYGFFVDTKPTQSSISDSKIQSYLAGLFQSGKVVPSSNTIYGIYFPPRMKITLSGGTSCSSFCGYHNHFTYNGLQIKYASFPYLNCTACKLSSLTVGDMMTIVTSHEIRESVTDPGDSNTNAWYDAAGYEADDKCAWHNLYQMTNGGFWVQPEYSNGGTVTASGFTATYPGPGCVVPR